jgi:hypothetical protein
MLDPRTVVLKEDLLAMKDTARSSGSLFVQEPSLGRVVMSETHETGVFDVEGSYYQAICSCQWLSTISFFEEVDLLRALHAHWVVVFGDVSVNGNTVEKWEM